MVAHMAKQILITIKNIKTLKQILIIIKNNILLIENKNDNIVK